MIAILVLYIVSFCIMTFVIRFMKNDMDDVLLILFKFISFIPIANSIMAFVGMILVIVFSLANTKRTRNLFYKVSKFLWGE